MSIARRLVHALIIVLTLVVGATAAAIIITQTAWFKNWLRAYVGREANQYLNGQLSIERLDGNLFFGIEMEGVGVSLDGREVVAVKDVGPDYNVFDILAKGFFVDDIRLNQLVLYLRREGDTWSIGRLIKKREQEADRRGPEYPIAIDAIGISDASIVVDDPVGTSGVDVPNRFDRVDAQLAFHYAPVHYSVEISHVSFRGVEPEIGLNALSGLIAVRDDTVYLERVAVRTEESSVALAGAIQHYLTKPVFNITASSDKLSVPELARAVPALAGVALQPAFELKVDGPMDALAVEMNVRSSAGQAAGTFVADVMAPGHSMTGSLSVRHLNLAPILKDATRQTDLTGDARVDVRASTFSDLNSLRGTVAVNAPRIVAVGYSAEKVKADARLEGRRVALKGQALAFGATATAAGRVTLPDGPEPLSYDLHGRTGRLDLRQLPRQLNVPAAETTINGDYHVRGTEPSGRGRSSASCTLEGELRFDESIVAGARIARGSTAGFSMRGRDIGYRFDATVVDVDVQRIGREFKVPALATDRYQSSLNGNVQGSGRGTTLKDLDLTTRRSMPITGTALAKSGSSTSPAET